MVVASAYQLIVRKVNVVASWATDETSGTKILEVSDETDLAVRGQRLKNESKTCLEYYHHYVRTLFVFSINGLNQNARSLVSGTDFYALLHGSLHFVLHGSSNNCLFRTFWLAVEEFQLIRNKKMVKKATMDRKTKGST